MPLSKPYPDDFERVWKVYPMWPKGRSVKQLAFKRFQLKKKENGWTEEDIATLIQVIEQQKKFRASWQRGDSYGPQGLQVWLYQNGWEHDYPTKKEKPQHRAAPDTPWTVRGLTRRQWEAEQDWLARKAMKMPQTFATAADAIAAASLENEEGDEDVARH